MGSESEEKLFNMTISDIIESCYGADNAKVIKDEIIKGYESGKEGEELQEHIKEVADKFEPGRDATVMAPVAAGVVVVPVVVSPTPLH